jgi:hypothetical protein
MIQPVLQQYLLILLHHYTEEQLRDKVVKIIDGFLYCAISSDIDNDFSCHDKEWDLTQGRIYWKYHSLESAIKLFCPPVNYMGVPICNEFELEIKKYY